MKNHPFEVGLTNEETYVTLLVVAAELDSKLPIKPDGKIETPYKNVVESQRKHQLAARKALIEAAKEDIKRPHVQESLTKLREAN